MLAARTTFSTPSPPLRVERSGPPASFTTTRASSARSYCKSYLERFGSPRLRPRLLGDALLMKMCDATAHRHHARRLCRDRTGDCRSCAEIGAASRFARLHRDRSPAELQTRRTKH